MFEPQLWFKYSFSGYLKPYLTFVGNMQQNILFALTMVFWLSPDDQNFWEVECQCN